MYIELAANHYQAPLGAKYDPLHIPLLMELVIYVGRLVYKHQAPTEPVFFNPRSENSFIYAILTKLNPKRIKKT